MELDQIWSAFLKELLQNELVENCFRNNVAGIPFLYVDIVNGRNSEWENHGSSILNHCAEKAMFQKRVTAETCYVRNNCHQYIYRHRFYVPQEKMFCCGNLCQDCIRLKNK